MPPALNASLYLTLQLFEAQIPTVLALNRMDAAKSAGIEIDASALSQALGVPVVPVTASQNEGTPALIRAVRDTVQKHRLPIVPRFDEPVQKALDDIADIVKTDAQNSCMPLRFCASKLFDSDPSMVFPFTLTKKQTDAIAQAVQAATSDGDSYAALADARYQFIERLCCQMRQEAENDLQRGADFRADRPSVNRKIHRFSDVFRYHGTCLFLHIRFSGRNTVVTLHSGN